MIMKDYLSGSQMKPVVLSVSANDHTRCSKMALSMLSSPDPGQDIDQSSQITQKRFRNVIHMAKDMT